MNTSEIITDRISKRQILDEVLNLLKAKEIPYLLPLFKSKNGVIWVVDISGTYADYSFITSYADSDLPEVQVRTNPLHDASSEFLTWLKSKLS